MSTPAPSTEAELRRRIQELEAENRALRGGPAELEQAHRALREELDEVHRAQAELVNSARLASLGMLVAGVAHELNTPLGALCSNRDVLRRALRRLAGILEDEVVEADELDELRRVVRALGEVMKVDEMAVDRMLQLVANLRSFGRLDSAEIDWYDLHQGLESTLALLRHELPARIRLVRQYGELPRIECYPSQLNQLFMNLLLNAAQAIRDEGTITLRTARQDGGVVVEVSDTGAGIRPENLERIFAPGFTTKGARVGMGLGLLICRRIVDHHGGRLAVSSVPGEGTTFTIHLPERLSRETPARETR